MNEMPGSRSRSYATELSVADRESIGDLITLAERIEGKLTLFQMLRVTSIGLSTLAASVLASFLFSLVDPFSETIRITEVFQEIAITAAFGAIVAGGAFASSHFSTRYKRERRAFTEVTTLIHEALEAMASSLPPLALAEHKIRLARLGL